MALYNWPGVVLRWCHSDCQSYQEKNSDKEEHSKACAGSNCDIKHRRGARNFEKP